MTARSLLAIEMSERDRKYLAEIDDCISELSTIRREMKKTDADIRRLTVSTRRKIDLLQANLHAEKAS